MGDSNLKTLRQGSTGIEVKIVQTLLNQIVSDLALLKPDGIFGPKTGQRVKELQSLGAILWGHLLTVDGIIGPQTWEAIKALTQLDNGMISRLAVQWVLRNRVVEIAIQEHATFGNGVINAKESGGHDPTNPKRIFRKGYVRLLEYFDATDPIKSIDRDSVKYLSSNGQPTFFFHWCGIFALYCHKRAYIQVGDWKAKNGISAVAGFHQVKTKSFQRGDVGYIENRQHHVVIEEAFYDKVSKTLKYKTIEGNSDPGSIINRRSTRTRGENDIKGAYTAFP